MKNQVKQYTVAKFHQHQRFYWDVSPRALLGLAKMYTQDERFENYFEQFGKGLAKYIYEAVAFYVQSIPNSELN